MNRRAIGLMVAASTMMSVAASAAPPTIKLEMANDGGGNQPHGHSSSQGSTSNLRSKVEKKRSKKLARKSRRRNKG